MNNILTAGGIPIGLIDWLDFNQHKDNIINFCLKNYKPNTIESNIAVRAKNNLWESDFSFLENKELSALKCWITIVLNKFVNQVNQSNYHVVLTESWAHVTNADGYHHPHRHPNSVWSGIFYIQQDDVDSGKNIFFNYYSLPKIPGYDFFCDQFEVDIVPGRLVLFPSSMLHYATSYLGTDQRIVIAFNSIIV